MDIRDGAKVITHFDGVDWMNGIDTQESKLRDWIGTY